MVPRPGSLSWRAPGVTLSAVSETLPFGDALARLSVLADRVEAGNERIVVTRNGRPSFVLVSPDDLDALEDTLAVLHRHPTYGRGGILG